MTFFNNNLALACAAWSILAASTYAGPPEFRRELTKEPAYKSTPQYFFLLFGPEAQTRIACVLDGDVLYFDHNGNGDLTEESECLVSEDGTFTVDEIKDAAGATHRNLRIAKPFGEDGETYSFITVKIRDKFEMYGIVIYDETVKSPATAPFRHFNGPVTATLSDKDVKLVRGEAQDVNVAIITHYPSGREKPDNDPWTAVDYDLVPEDIHPMLEFSFPAAADSADRVSLKVFLKQRC